MSAFAVDVIVDEGEAPSSPVPSPAAIAAYFSVAVPGDTIRARLQLIVCSHYSTCATLLSKRPVTIDL